jgi:UDP-N-acetylmuramate--alanine ligase
MPHLYTRTRDLADNFAKSLSLLDEVILLPIYPAREEPIPGITSEWLLSKITQSNKRVCSKEGLLDYLRDKDNHFEVVATLGAGDVDLMLPQIKEILLNK